MWVLPGGDAPDTLREEKAPKGKSQERRRCERKTGKGSEGVSRQEGNQTLEAEHSGCGKPASGRPPIPDVLKGTKAHERSGPAPAGRLGFAG